MGDGLVGPGLPLELLPPGAAALPVMAWEVAQELPLERLRISNGTEVRTIWGVHRGGWQALGWTVLGPMTAEPAGPEPATPEPAGPEPVVPIPAAAELPTHGEALLAGEEPDFGAMTKAQIGSFCLATYGVALDVDQTKPQLIAQAEALALADGGLPEGLL